MECEDVATGSLNTGHSRTLQSLQEIPRQEIQEKEIHSDSGGNLPELTEEIHWKSLPANTLQPTAFPLEETSHITANKAHSFFVVVNVLLFMKFSIT